ncbi:MAG TPA: translation initiation factor IF-2 N-terminal domain-containing protein, partial [Thermodesulfobacteriota bacterium]|nr:translation initiation factor IF-2 N-terminal domain-containing protein [Thermodesulfobacteriota bacterium]
MVKKRVHELAKELNLSSKELVKTIKKIGIPVQNHMSALEPQDEERILQYLTPPEEKKVVEARVKPSVIRRRVERLKVEPEVIEAPPPLLAKEEPAIEKPETKEEPPTEKPPQEVEPFIEKPPVSAEIFLEKELEEPPERPQKPLAEILEPVSPPEPKLQEPITGEVAPARIKDEGEEKPLKSAPKPKIRPTQIKEGLVPKKKWPKHKEEPAQIIRKPELPPVFIGEPEVSAETAESKPKKKRILISDVEPSVEKIFRKKLKRETKATPPSPKAFRKKERKIFREEGVEPLIAKKTEITVPKAIKRKIKIAELITVSELAKKMGVKASAVIKKLWELGLMATINQAIDIDTAQLASEEFGYEVEKVSFDEEELLAREEDDVAHLHHRPPV